MELNNHASCKLDRNRAIFRELTRGLHLLTQLRLLIEDRSEMARELCQEVRKALETSLSFVNSMDNLERSQEPLMGSQVDSQSSYYRYWRIPTADKGFKRYGSEDLNPRDQSRRKVIWKTMVTLNPFNDGYQWRKYGQKEIQNFSHPRSYYRCTYDNCNAKKQVQQKNSTNPPLYEVIYKNIEHTCNTTRQPFPEAILPSSSEPEGTRMISFGSSASNMKQPKGEDVGTSTSSANNAKSCQTSAENLNSAGIDLISPPSPPGPFYGPDASAYNGLG